MEEKRRAVSVRKARRRESPGKVPISVLIQFEVEKRTQHEEIKFVIALHFYYQVVDLMPCQKSHYESPEKWIGH